MSVATMARLAEEPADKVPAAAAADTDSTFRSSLTLLAAYIPSEALAAYLAALGFLVPATDATVEQIFNVRVICFAIGFALALVLAVVTFNGRGLHIREQVKRRVLLALLAGVAFAIYSAATPSFFWSDLRFLTIAFTQWAAVAAIVTAMGLPYFAKALGVRKSPA